MDILISSNLERLIYSILGNDAEACAEKMKSLREEGYYEITEEQKEKLSDFCGYFCDMENTKKAIASLYSKEKYVIDTHTAVAADVYGRYRAETGDDRPAVIASTASPFKFTRSVIEALESVREMPGDIANMDDFDLADLLSEISGVPVPGAVEEIRTAPILHKKVVDAGDMPQAVYDFLGIQK